MQVIINIYKENFKNIKTKNNFQNFNSQNGFVVAFIFFYALKFSGDVQYTANGFLEKNMVKTMPKAVAIMRTSNNPVVQVSSQEQKTYQKKKLLMMFGKKLTIMNTSFETI